MEGKVEIVGLTGEGRCDVSLSTILPSFAGAFEPASPAAPFSSSSSPSSSKLITAGPCNPVSNRPQPPSARLLPFTPSRVHSSLCPSNPAPGLSTTGVVASGKMSR